jgi:ATP-dependent helicase/DNAse subunit B
MPLKRRGTATIWVGPATCGKTAAALEEYGLMLLEGGTNRASAGMWIAPSRRVAADVRESLATAHPALLGPGTTTFGELAAEVLRVSGLLVLPINPQQRRRLFRRLIDEAAAEGLLKHYAPLAATEGLAGLVDGAVAHLQRQGQTVAEVRKRGLRDADDQALDLALLYERFLERVATANIADAQTIIEIAVAALATRPLPEVSWKLVVVDGFAAFTAHELRLLAEVGRRCARMIVTLPGDEAGREDLFALTARTIEE